MNFIDIVGFEEYFMVSSCGKIFSKRSNKILKTIIHKEGYELFSSKIGGRNGKNICLRVHRCVAIAFIDNPDNKPEVNHIDGNKTNNNVSNLEWVTSKENSAHSFKIGLSKNKGGVDKENAKLSTEDIIFIKNNSKRLGGKYKSSELAVMFGVHKSNIDRVIRGASYKNS